MTRGARIFAGGKAAAVVCLHNAAGGDGARHGAPAREPEGHLDAPVLERGFAEELQGGVRHIPVQGSVRAIATAPFSHRIEIGRAGA